MHLDYCRRALARLLIGLGALATVSLYAQSQKPVMTPDNAPIGKLSHEDSSNPLKEDPTPIPPPPGAVPKSVVIAGDSSSTPYVFVVDKSARTLTVWKNLKKSLKLEAAHAIDLGKKVGDKQRLGDLKTPEGIYFFQETYRDRALDFSEYGSRAFTLDYPNFFDRADGKSGSGIWLHAVPDSKSLWRGSRGCIVVRNKVVKKLEKYINLTRTPVIVTNSVDYISQAEHQQQVSNWNNWLEAWRMSWTTKDLPSYIEHYAEEFSSKGMSKDQWRRYKDSLNKKYEYIKVAIAKPMILVHNNEAIIRFLQKYESNVNSDFGEKTLHLKSKENRPFKIHSEEWRSLSAELLALEKGEKQDPKN